MRDGGAGRAAGCRRAGHGRRRCRFPAARHVATGKIARDGAGLTLELEPTTDILAEAVRRRARQRPVHRSIVGFAAETGSLDRARDKAERKGVDLLVANDVAEAGSAALARTRTA